MPLYETPPKCLLLGMDITQRVVTSPFCTTATPPVQLRAHPHRSEGFTRPTLIGARGLPAHILCNVHAEKQTYRGRFIEGHIQFRINITSVYIDPPRALPGPPGAPPESPKALPKLLQTLPQALPGPPRAMPRFGGGSGGGQGPCRLIKHI